jgi:hypothetical protein
VWWGRGEERGRASERERDVGEEVGRRGGEERRKGETPRNHKKRKEKDEFVC